MCWWQSIKLKQKFNCVRWILWKCFFRIQKERTKSNFDSMLFFFSQCNTKTFIFQCNVKSFVFFFQFPSVRKCRFFTESLIFYNVFCQVEWQIHSQDSIKYFHYFWQINKLQAQKPINSELSNGEKYWLREDLVGERQTLCWLVCYNSSTSRGALKLTPLWP